MARRQTRRTVSLNRALYDAAMREADRRGVSLAELTSLALRAIGVVAPKTVHTPKALAMRAASVRHGRKRSQPSQSFAVVHEHYEAARSLVGRSKPNRGTKPEDAQRQTFNRAVSVEFHRRLKQAGIAVEGA